MIIDHNHRQYRAVRNVSGSNKHNGAFYYSIEILNNIIPRVKTDRHWVTIRVPGKAFDHCIYFIHNNIHIDSYEFLKAYDDVILVCGVPETMDKVRHLGTPIYLPLSIDVAEVEAYIKPKTKDVAYVGRYSKRNGLPLWNIDCIEDVNRHVLLDRMAEYERVYAIGRCAVEAKCLGCEVLPFDPRYPDPELWQVLDNAEAAEILQKELDKIDGPFDETKGTGEQTEVGIGRNKLRQAASISKAVQGNAARDRGN